MNFVTYVLLNSDGIVFYVGAGSPSRPLKHLSSSGGRPQVQSVIDDHRKRGLDISYKIISHHESKEDAFNAEKMLISMLGKVENGGLLLNVCDGGAGSPGYRASEQQRLENAERQRVRFLNVDERLKTSITTRIAMEDPQIRSKISMGMLNKWEDEDYRNRQIASHTGKKDTEITRKKKSSSLVNAWLDGKRSGKYSDEVVGEVYSSKGLMHVNEVAERYGMNPTYVHKIWRHERCVTALKRLGVI